MSSVQRLSSLDVSIGILNLLREENISMYENIDIARDDQQKRFIEELDAKVKIISRLLAKDIDNYKNHDVIQSVAITLLKQGLCLHLVHRFVIEYFLHAKNEGVNIICASTKEGIDSDDEESNPVDFYYFGFIGKVIADDLLFIKKGSILPTKKDIKNNCIPIDEFLLQQEDDSVIADPLLDNTFTAKNFHKSILFSFCKNFKISHVVGVKRFDKSAVESAKTIINQAKRIAQVTELILSARSKPEDPPLTAKEHLMGILKRLKLNPEDYNKLHVLEQALRRAAGYGTVQDLSILLQTGISINAQDSNPQKRETALHIAMRETITDNAKFLIENGAKMTICDAYGKTAQDYFEDIKKKYKQIKDEDKTSSMDNKNQSSINSRLQEVATTEISSVIASSSSSSSSTIDELDRYFKSCKSYIVEPLEKLFKALADKGIKKINDLQPSEIVALASGFATSNIQPPEGLFEALAEEAIKKISGFKPKNIINLASAFATLKIHPTAPLFKVLALVAINNIAFELEDIFKLEEAFEMLEIQGPVDRSVFGPVIRLIKKMKMTSTVDEDEYPEPAEYALNTIKMFLAGDLYRKWDPGYYFRVYLISVIDSQISKLSRNDMKMFVVHFHKQFHLLNDDNRKAHFSMLLRLFSPNEFSIDSIEYIGAIYRAQPDCYIIFKSFPEKDRTFDNFKHLYEVIEDITDQELIKKICKRYAEFQEKTLDNFIKACREFTITDHTDK